MEDIDLQSNRSRMEKVISLHPMDTGSLIATLVILCPIVLLVVLGNLLVVLVIFLDRHLRKPQNMLVASLAIVDLSMGLWVLPLNILKLVQGGWLLGRGVCKFYVTLDVTLCCMSIQHICAIAWDRYRAIHDGILYIQQRSYRSVILTIGAICILSILLSSPPVLGWDGNWLADMDSTKLCYYLKSRGYTVYMSTGALFIPMFLMVYLYTKIYYALRQRIREKAKIELIKPSLSLNIITVKQAEANKAAVVELAKGKIIRNLVEASADVNESDNGTDNDNQTERRSEQFQEFVAMKQKFSLTKERNAARTLGMIMGAFIVCWLPFCLVYISTPFLPSQYEPSIFVVEFCVWLGFFNSALNPIIYAVYNPEFRKAFKKILRFSRN